MTQRKRNFPNSSQISVSGLLDNEIPWIVSKDTHQTFIVMFELVHSGDGWDSCVKITGTVDEPKLQVLILSRTGSKTLCALGSSCFGSLAPSSSVMAWVRVRS